MCPFFSGAPQRVFDGLLRLSDDVGPGLNVCAHDILLENGIRQAHVHAQRDVHVHCGARGNFQLNCHVFAGRNARLSFTDKAYVRAGRDIDIDVALHSHLIAERHILIRQNLRGGHAWAGHTILVQGNAGTPAFTPTRLQLGALPFLCSAIQRCQAKLATHTQNVTRCEPLAAHLPPDFNDAARRLAKARRFSNILQKQIDFLEKLRHQRRQENATGPAPLSTNEHQAPPAGIVVLGTLYPGVEIVIDTLRLYVESPLARVHLVRHHNSIIAMPLPQTS